MNQVIDLEAGSNHRYHKTIAWLTDFKLSLFQTMKDNSRC